MLRLLRKVAGIFVELLAKVMRDDEMPSGSGKGIHVTKSGMLYVDIEEIHNSDGSKEAARRGYSVLSAEYRPRHHRNENVEESSTWTIHCGKCESDQSALSLELPIELADLLSVKEGDFLIVTRVGPSKVSMHKRLANPKT